MTPREMLLWVRDAEVVVPGRSLTLAPPSARTVTACEPSSGATGTALETETASVPIPVPGHVMLLEIA